ncbi:exported hypothetical protein [Burkholderia vietnamiensis]|nr:exported hypothetical protein [Burkholderia vietnamiensis]
MTSTSCRVFFCIAPVSHLTNSRCAPAAVERPRGITTHAHSFTYRVAAHTHGGIMIGIMPSVLSGGTVPRCHAKENGNEDDDGCARADRRGCTPGRRRAAAGRRRETGRRTPDDAVRVRPRRARQEHVHGRLRGELAARARRRLRPRRGPAHPRRARRRQQAMGISRPSAVSLEDGPQGRRRERRRGRRHVARRASLSERRPDGARRAMREASG